jgi:hypothetical protein
MKISACFRVPAGKERNLMSEINEFVHQPRDHTFGTAIELGRNAFRQWSELSDAHERLSVRADSRPHRNYCGRREQI